MYSFSAGYGAAILHVPENTTFYGAFKRRCEFKCMKWLISLKRMRRFYYNFFFSFMVSPSILSFNLCWRMKGGLHWELQIAFGSQFMIILSTRPRLSKFGRLSAKNRRPLKTFLLSLSANLMTPPIYLTTFMVWNLIMFIFDQVAHTKPEQNNFWLLIQQELFQSWSTMDILFTSRMSKSSIFRQEK